VLAELQAALSQQQKMLLEGHRRLTDAQSRPTGTTDMAEHLVRVITDRNEILRISKHLINSAHRDWMTLESHETDMPLTDDYPIDGPPALRHQVRIRSIYDIALTEHPAASRYIEEFVKAGEEARILPRVPMKMQLADETAVLLPLTQNGASGALLIKDGPIPRAMRTFFEMLWARATPWSLGEPQPHSPLSPPEQRILEFMAAGKQDKAITRAVNSSETTVRRHIKAITDRLGLKTTSRFALGLAIGRSGWLVCDNENPATDKDGHA
jgi:DNA-binding CsgD family transcriptional regulator